MNTIFARVRRTIADHDLARPETRVAIGGKGDITHQIAGATITAWNDRSDWWDSDPLRADIREAMELIEDPW